MQYVGIWNRSGCRDGGNGPVKNGETRDDLSVTAFRGIVGRCRAVPAASPVTCEGPCLDFPEFPHKKRKHQQKCYKGTVIPLSAVVDYYSKKIL